MNLERIQPSAGNERIIQTRLTGAPPLEALKRVGIEDFRLYVWEFKRLLKRYYKLNPMLDIQLIFKGKVLPDTLLLNKIGLHPEKDVITIMALQGGG